MSDLLTRTIDRVKTMLTGGLVKSVIDTGQIQLVKIAGMAGGTQDGLERLQNYGLSSNPPVNSEAVVAYLGGKEDHGIVIVCDAGAYRIKGLANGETAVYSQFGQKIHLKADGSVEITAPAGVSVGAGSDAVAMAAKTDTIRTTIASAATGQVCASTGEACPLATALVAALNALSSTASTNMRAD